MWQPRDFLADATFSSIGSYVMGTLVLTGRQYVTSTESAPLARQELDGKMGVEWSGVASVFFPSSSMTRMLSPQVLGPIGLLMVELQHGTSPSVICCFWNPPSPHSDLILRSLAFIK